MTTLGYVFLLVALLLIRGASKGRSIAQLPGDLWSMLNALIGGDQVGLSSALGLTGDTQDATTIAAGTPTPATGGSSAGGTTLLSECKRIGNGKPYRLGTTGPNSFDCSGLIFRAMSNLAMYKGVRFTTFTFAVQCRSIVTKTSTAAVGDLIVWHGVPEHMGIIDGADSFYSALNPRVGIKSLSIKAMGGHPLFYRPIGPNNYVTPDGKAPGASGGSVIPGIVAHGSVTPRVFPTPNGQAPPPTIFGN